MFQVADQYPPHTAAGCDYFSRAPLGDIVEQHGDDQIIRRERVLDTGLDLDFEGRIAIGERTVRHWASLFGMVDGWRVQNLMAMTQAVVDERDLMSRELAESRAQIANLLEVQREPVTEVFVALDGARHASAQAAESENRKAAGLPSRAVVGVRPIKPEEVEGPKPKARAKK